MFCFLLCRCFGCAIAVPKEAQALASCSACVDVCSASRPPAECVYTTRRGDWGMLFGPRRDRGLWGACLLFAHAAGGLRCLPGAPPQRCLAAMHCAAACARLQRPNLLWGSIFLRSSSHRLATPAWCHCTRLHVYICLWDAGNCARLMPPVHACAHAPPPCTCRWGPRTVSARALFAAVLSGCRNDDLSTNAFKACILLPFAWSASS